MRIAAQYVLSKVEGLLRVVEIGVHTAENAKTLLELPLEYLFLVDKYAPYYAFPQDQQNTIKAEMLAKVSLFSEAGYPPIGILLMDSVYAATIFPDEFFDLVYIDGDHYYEPVLRDLQAWYPKVKKGRFLAGHDYIRGEEGVAQAVHEFSNKNGLEVLSWLSKGDVIADDMDDWLVVRK